MVQQIYLRTGRTVEKYDVLSSGPAVGGEYPLQDGFCWTNGVARALARLYPDILRNDNPPRPLAVELPEMD